MPERPSSASPSHAPVRGYLEGYYGRLLDWSERHAILDTLAGLGMNAYAYAPKEDVRHRLRWREPYEAAWLDPFAAFCAAARERGIGVLAGVAPGLDFDFAALDGGADLDAARVKLERLRECGATRLMLLMDDIDADFERRSGGRAAEGEAHAALANRLGEALDENLVVVPRIYAAELARDAPDYLGDFAATLDARHGISVCGGDIVAREVRPADCVLPGEAMRDGSHAAPEVASRAASRETILWDNLYANDYCPRRLFVGAWCGRHDIDEVLLNGTGLPETDRLLLSLMAAGGDADAAGGTGTGGSGASGADAGEANGDAAARARAVREAHGVPPAFRHVAAAFAHPVTNDRLDVATETPVATPEVLDAIDELLWRWKTPLAREWYPYLFGLRHDLLLAAGTLTSDRIRKTQTPALARVLLDGVQVSRT